MRKGQREKVKKRAKDEEVNGQGRSKGGKGVHRPHAGYFWQSSGNRAPVLVSYVEKNRRLMIFASTERKRDCSIHTVQGPSTRVVWTDTISDLNSLHFVVNRFFMKLFKTCNIDLVKCCHSYFYFELPSVLHDKRARKFDIRYRNHSHLLFLSDD